MNKDIQSPYNLNSIEGVVFRNLGPIYLQEFRELEEFDYSGFRRFEFILSKENGGEASLEEKEEKLKRILEIVGQTKSLTEEKFKYSRICLFEAIRNAQKHGNGLDESALIRIGYKKNPGNIELIVEDSGICGIDPDFFPYRSYVLESLKNDKNSIDDFYSHYQRVPKKDNGGVGTRTIHQFSDEVLYSKSDLGGLLVQMTHLLN